MHTSPWQDQDH